MVSGSGLLGNNIGLVPRHGELPFLGVSNDVATLVATLGTKLKLVGASDKSGIAPASVYPELAFYPIGSLFGIITNQMFN